MTTAPQLEGLIDPHWTLEDLDPHTWRTIGPFIDPGRYVMAGSRDEHGLFILHDQGRVLRVFDSRSGRRDDLGIERADAPGDLAATLYERDEWDRVHVIDRAHLARVAATAQATPQRELTLDAYYRRVAGLIWGDPAGYACVPPRPGHWNHWTYSGIVEFLRALPSPSSLTLGVINDGAVDIGLIARIGDGLIRQVTTFEALPADRPEPAVSDAFAGWLWRAVAEIAPPAVMLLCTPEVFTAWIEGDRKREILADAVAAGTAILRFGESPDDGAVPETKS